MNISLLKRRRYLKLENGFRLIILANNWTMIYIVCSKLELLTIIAVTLWKSKTYMFGFHTLCKLYGLIYI